MTYFLQLYRKRLVWWFLWLGSGLIAQPVWAQISFRLVLDQDEITYQVYLTSTVSYSGIQAIIPTAQVTLSVPHGTGNDRFLVTNLTSPVPRMRWRQSDRADAPVENPDRDYLFFSFTNDATPLVQFPVVAGQEVLLFTFQRKGNCLGRIDLLNNTTDPFRTPNSLGINVGNSIALVGMRTDAYRDLPEFSSTVNVQVSSATICAGEVLSLSAVLSTAAGNTPAVTYTYQWFTDNQSMGPATSSPTLSYTFTNPAATYRATIRVRLTVATEPLCRSPLLTATQIVVVRPTPAAIVQYTGDPCTLLPIDLSVAPVPGVTYQWLRDTTVLRGQTSSVLHVQESGKYAVRVTDNGCSATSVAIPVLGVGKGGQITIQFSSIPPVVRGTRLILDPQVSNASSFSWLPSDGLSSTSIQNPVATPTTTTTYTLTARSTQGCEVTDTVTVRVFPPLYIPTAFTPNGDGVNDTWEIRNVGAYLSCHVRVFDRWGGQVFFSADYATPWDGKINGSQAMSGMYLYSVQTPLAVYQGELTVL